MYSSLAYYWHLVKSSKKNFLFNVFKTTNAVKIIFRISSRITHIYSIRLYIRQLSVNTCLIGCCTTPNTSNVPNIASLENKMMFAIYIFIS